MDEKMMVKRNIYHANSEGITAWYDEHGTKQDSTSSYYEDRRVLSGVDPVEEYNLEQRRTLFEMNLNALDQSKVEFDMIKGSVNMAVLRRDGDGEVAEMHNVKDFEEEYSSLLNKYKTMSAEMQELQKTAYKDERAVVFLKDTLEEEKQRRKTIDEGMDELRDKWAKVSYQNSQLVAKNTILENNNERMSKELIQYKEELEEMRNRLKRDERKDFHSRVTNWANTQLIRCTPYLGITFGSEPKNGTYLRAVSRDQAAYGSGLREGDIIAEVNGQPTRTKNEFYKQLHGITTGQEFKVKVFRPGTGFFDVQDGDIAATTELAHQLAHKPLHLTIRMGAHEMPYTQLLSTLRLAQHVTDPSLYTDLNTASDFKHDVVLSGYVDENDEE